MKHIPALAAGVLFPSTMRSAVSASSKHSKEETPMEKILSCCGMICSDCEYYPTDCPGCSEIKGKAFWLEYTGEDCCEIYNCCINKKGYQNCGQCDKLPCSQYENEDPTKSKEENTADHCMQMKNLEQYRKAVHVESLIRMLEEKDTSKAYKALQELEKISDETGLTYSYIDKFVDMICSDKYVIRVRGFRLFCKQAKWDMDFIIDESIDTALNILKDEKPTAVRQALAALIDIVRYKPDLREVVKAAVLDIDYLQYMDTMHSLLAKDIDKVLSLIRELDN